MRGEFKVKTEKVPFGGIWGGGRREEQSQQTWLKRAGRDNGEAAQLQPSGVSSWSKPLLPGQEAGGWEVGKASVALRGSRCGHGHAASWMWSFKGSSTPAWRAPHTHRTPLQAGSSGHEVSA